MPQRPKASVASLAPLLALCLAFTILVGMHTGVTPLFEAPDEVWHYAYVRWLAQGNGLPPLDEDLSGAYQEAAQPPLYYLVAALLNARFDDSDLSTLMWHNPGFGYQAPGTVADNKNMLVHTAEEAFPWRGAALAVHATRATSWLFGLVTVIAAWSLGQEVFRNRALATTVAALVALQPQFVFISSIVSNDSAAAALSTLGLWFAARMLVRGPTWRTTILAGLTAGLGALAKTSVLPLAPALAISLLVGSVHGHSGRHQPIKLRRVAGQLLLLSAIALAVSGWWYGRNIALYGDPLGLSTHTQTLWGREELASLPELLPELPLLWRSFWGAYGWGHVFWPDGVYVALTVVTLPLLGLASIAVGLTWIRALRTASGIGARIRDDRATPSWLLPASLALVWSLGIVAALLRWMQQVEAPHGRLLFPAIGAWALLLTLGIRTIGRYNQGTGYWYRAATLVTFTIVVGLAPVARILATFAPPRLQDRESVAAACDQPANLVYGNHIELLCLEPEPARVAPGEPTDIRACWTATEVVAYDYTVYVHLLGPNMQRYAERHTYPGLGRYPTTLWEPGRAFCETYHLAVEPWAGGPVRAQVEVGLYDAESGARLPVANDTGQEVVLPIAGHVDIAEKPDGAAANAGDALATFGAATTPAIQLLASSVPTSAARGEEIEVVLNWVALAPPDQDYVAFVHVWTPGQAKPMAQSDAQPRGGWYPTSAWQSGDSVQDRHTLAIPETAAPGRYPVWAGLYRPGDGTRLAAYSATARYPNDLVPLGTLDVH
ncbi:MAG: glycosyltransferase family 39 protein [Anaerolineae bacterium]|nr:glycosyltransferase family 39 protein [Anaerolineae bacterium]